MAARKVYILFIIFTLAFTLFFPRQTACGDEGLGKKVYEIEREMTIDGDYESAIIKFESLLAQHPEDPAVNIGLGLALYGIMEYREAYNRLKRANELGPDRDSAELLDYAISVMDENRDLLWEMEDNKNGIFIIKEEGGETTVDTLAAGHVVLLKELLGDKYYYSAVVAPHIFWLKKNAPDLEGIDAFAADVYYSAMFYQKASEEYEKAIEEDPDNIRFNNTLADCFVAMGDFDSAQGYYEKTVELYKKSGLDTNSPEIKRLKGIIQAMPRKYDDIIGLIKEKRLREAEEICRRRISLNPGDYPAITHLGEIYWEKGNRPAAIKMFRRAMKIAPEYPTPHIFIGRAYFLERKPEKGAAEFDIFIKNMDRLPEMKGKTLDFYISALHYINSFYLDDHMNEKALEGYKKIVELDPEDQEGHYGLAVVYYNHYHNRSKAYASLQKVIELDPSSKMADIAEENIDYIRKVPDSRFTSRARIGAHTAEIERIVRNQAALNWPYATGKKRKTEEDEKDNRK